MEKLLSDYIIIYIVSWRYANRGIFEMRSISFVSKAFEVLAFYIKPCFTKERCLTSQGLKFGLALVAHHQSDRSAHSHPLLNYPTISYTISYHTNTRKDKTRPTPHHTIPYHTIPCHTLPYPTLPYHIIPYSIYLNVNVNRSVNVYI